MLIPSRRRSHRMPFLAVVYIADRGSTGRKRDALQPELSHIDTVCPRKTSHRVCHASGSRMIPSIPTPCRDWSYSVAQRGPHPAEVTNSFLCAASLKAACCGPAIYNPPPPIGVVEWAVLEGAEEFGVDVPHLLISIFPFIFRSVRCDRAQCSIEQVCLTSKAQLNQQLTFSHVFRDGNLVASHQCFISIRTASQRQRQ